MTERCEGRAQWFALRLGSQPTKECANVLGKQFGFLGGREVASARHLGPGWSGPATCSTGPRRAWKVGREYGDRGGDADPAQRLRVRLEVGQERAAYGSCGPVNGDDGQQLVLAEAPFYHAFAVAPVAELLHHPRG